MRAARAWSNVLSVRDLPYRVRRSSSAVAFGLGARLWHLVLDPHQAWPSPLEAMAAWLRQQALIARDLENVRAGYYPRALLDDISLRGYLRAAPALTRDGLRMRRRRASAHHADLPASIPKERYPDYYLRNFHWQEDGWLSRRSAEHYELGVQLLFSGMTGAMRRMAIPPLVRGVGRAAKILDVACGSGHFMRQLETALPEAQLTGLDLSPYYVAHASRVVDRRERFTVANAEAMPFDAASFDAAVSIFLFHELPLGARRRVLAEMFRVVRPGGTVVLCDSAQAGEEGGVGFYFEAFPRLYHEPFYESYRRHPLEELLEEAGFAVGGREVWLWSKVVWAERPM